ncbi:MAG: hypothetical protein A3C30_02005 [Candidatus Levybacteria bacterium RIFCSPHIGHO2_02_FULL_40_18]|nr:MAG: hypothetical protein A2869_04385 [Candidatus Levybacteria bacterium RIFCSPHIGHO2_01_FULL_40_58]OGH26764.1 MAG: hypothetical protein A3C30_02005 [Candidatus Levybacteria bacterium RIFCSPHIGHO2_02_FULL_40_18]OGH31699.1 MAG: hypothetical protein A3E43_01725 [Candidatus Levybacteria bacterium RIFCSPHIGHO2_12_FULL_40_31]OGH40599.1 MAG: hypothetical protein A2894_00275 [Candidatus Levybacteria bacterium RIFCSPLOWO2_01_FULL_40_64]OGH53318.1 MAG: hypothetical protein A3G15_04840 [Candidatus Lev
MIFISEIKNQLVWYHYPMQIESAFTKDRAVLRFYLLLGLFFISRLIFLSPDPVFFDSPEYLRRLEMDDWPRSLIDGHPPFHTGYILLFWPIFHFGKFLGVNGAFLVVLTQAILATFAIWCFYKSILLLANRRIAIWASIIASALPLWWIVTDSVMMEAGYSSTFLISFYFFLLFLKKQNLAFFLTSMVFFFLALLTHIAVLFWIPLFFFAIFRISKNQRAKLIVYATAGFVATTIAIVYFLAHVGSLSLIESASLIFLSKTGEHVEISLSAIGIAQLVRNTMVPMIVNNTSLIVILSIFSLFILWRKDKSYFFLGLLWILPITITNNWWDSLLFGRHALLASFGSAFLVGSLLEKSKKKFFIVIFYLLVVSLPAVTHLRQPIPYIEEAAAVEKLPKGGLILETHFARPQVEKKYEGKIIFVNEPGWDRADTLEQIRTFLASDRPVFVTSQALSDPYGLYSGPYIHSLSLSYAHPFVLQGIIDRFTLEKYKIISEKDNLLIYKVLNDNPSPYPEIKKVNQSRRRIDYFDPITQLINIFKARANLKL